MNLPLVTIRINSYNHATYLEEAVMAVVNQTYKNIQIIAIDDGSTDNSSEILERLSKKYNFFYKTQNNKGFSATLNDILKNYAKGKYIIGTSSDDVLELDVVEKYVDFLEKNPTYGMCFGNVYKIDSNSTKIGEIIGSNQSGNLFENIALGKTTFPLMSLMWRMDIFKKIGYYEESLATEDIYMLYKVSKNYEIGYVDTFAKKYRVHKENSTTNHWLMYNNAKQVSELYKGEDFYNKMMKIKHLQWFYLLSRKYKSESLKFIIDALKFPTNKLFIGGIINLIGLGFIIDKKRY